MLISRRAVVILAAALAGLAFAVPTGVAQAPGTTTLTFYEPDEEGTFGFIDNAPKSPTKNLESRRYRFSLGDRLTFVNPLYDRKGGTRLGTLYGDAVVVKGRTFASLLVSATATYVLNDGSQIVAQGTLPLAKTGQIPVIGGTGARLGARGFLVTSSTEEASVDTITLLP